MAFFQRRTMAKKRRTSNTLEDRIQTALDVAAIDEAMSLARELWAEQPGNVVALQALFLGYRKAKNFDAIRNLLREIAGDDPLLPAVRFWWLELLFAEGKRDVALELAMQIIDNQPGATFLLHDVLDSVWQLQRNISDVQTLIRHFYRQNLKSKDYLLLLAESWTWDFQYGKALEQLDSAISIYPGDKELLVARTEYLQKHKDHLAGQGIGRLWGWDKGDAAHRYKELMQLEPEKTTWQGYYLIARALQLFPPFRWYYFKYNLFAYAFWGLRPFWHLLLLIPFVIHFKNTPFSPGDPWIWAMEIVASVSIVRFTLFPLLVQLIAWIEMPRYNLLKRPRSFFYGLAYLVIWIGVAAYPMYQKSFYLMFAATFPMNFLAFEMARMEEIQVLEKRSLLVSGWAAVVLSILSFAEIIPEDFKFFIFGGFLLHMAVYAVTNAISEKRMQGKTIRGFVNGIKKRFG